MRTSSDLNPYQWTGVRFLAQTPFGAYWLDMGLGKTVTALTAIVVLKELGLVRRVIIFAPLRVAAQTWPTEIAEWLHTHDLTYTVIRATPDHPRAKAARQTARRAARRIGLASDVASRLADRAGKATEEAIRLEQLAEQTDIHIINRERIPWLVETWGRRWPYDTAVYDEASGLRDHKTHRVKSLVRVRPKLERFWELTGTPAPETYIDLFAQIYLLDRGERFGRFVTKFRERYFDYNEYKRIYKLKEGAADAIIEKIGELALVMRAEDHLDLEDPVVVDRVIEFDEPTMAQYRKMERDLVIKIGDVEVISETQGALGQKLLQFASGAVYDENKKAVPVHDHKIDELREILEEARGAPVIVAYWFKSNLARLQKAFPQGQALDKDAKLEKAWTAGKVPLMFVHPQSAGHGLNLQYGGHILVFFDVPWSLELYLQMIGRIARQGQTKVPMVFHLIVKGTIEEGIVPRLREKEQGQNYLKAEVQRLYEQRKAA